MNLPEMIETAMRGESITRSEALDILRCPDDDVMSVVAAAGTVRRHFFGTGVKLNTIVSLKTGLCPEDCHYCSQALGSVAQVPKQRWIDDEEIAAAVDDGVAQGASTICLVTSGRGPSRREVERMAGVVESISSAYPDVAICTCMGFMDESAVRALGEAGADRYNHNLNTTPENYPQICSTHGFDDRRSQVEIAQRAGLSACSGLIVGMGETDDGLVDVIFQLREMGVDSVPVNFLIPIEGTPMAGRRNLTPLRCLRVLAMTRFVHPDVEVRCAAGREHHFRSLQGLVLELCDSIFLGNYATEHGQGSSADHEMIEDMGFHVVPASEVHASKRAFAG